MISIPRLLIAAPSSGCGKSVISSGLMAAFSQRIPVQGFKVGPDYIDPMYHSAATGRPSRNLDVWMLPPETVIESFINASRGASLSVIEGVMGMFDGYGGDASRSSSAGIARLLQIPVILVVDCGKMSESAAAVVHGFHTYWPEVRLSGVICNRVGSRRHGAWLKEAIEMKNGIPVLGCLPRLEELCLPERHLGLFTVAERPEAVQRFLVQAGSIMEQYVDLDSLIDIAGRAPDLSESASPAEVVKPKVKLAVARDEAFCFYYEDNLEQLSRFGAEIIPFSPVRDEQLPHGIAGIYLGGGYPELYAAQLSANKSLLRHILACCRQDMPVYAECGGLIYLTEGLCDAAGCHELAGALPGRCEMGKQLCMGYREVEVIRPTLLSQAGAIMRGHEFHYSQWQNPHPERAMYRIIPRDAADAIRFEGYVQGNLQVSYIHLHFGQNAALAENFINNALIWQESHQLFME